MKKKILLTAIFLASALGLSAATNDLTSLLQQGLFDEEANHDLTSAIADYQSLATQFDRDRQVAATAIYRLGECYRKLGETNEAVGEYQRILKEFGEQKDLVTLSQQNLSGLGVATGNQIQQRLSGMAREATSGAKTSEDREAQQLLAEEIKVVEQQLADAQKQFQVGAMPQNGIWPLKQKLLELKRQKVALEAGSAISSQSETGSAATVGEEANRLAAQLAGLAQQTAEEPEKRARAVLADFPNQSLYLDLVHLRTLQDQESQALSRTDLLISTFVGAIGDTWNSPTNTAEFSLMAQQELQKQGVVVGRAADDIVIGQIERLQKLRSAAEAGLLLNVSNELRGRIFISGAVRSPGPIEIRTNENLTVGQAILEAGGLGDFADKMKVKVVRAAPETNEDKTVILDIGEILDKGHIEKDIVLKPGDFIVVPSRFFNF